MGSRRHDFTALLVAIFGLLTTFCAVASEGGTHGGGGGNGDANAKLALQKLMTDDAYNLKASMRNYLNTLNPNLVSDPAVRATLVRIGKNALIRDINETRYKIESGASEALVPNLGNKFGIKMRPAATTDFAAHADVRFDLDLMFSELKNLPEEDQMIALASLALHEHIHHFQPTPASGANKEKTLLANESEAYEFSGYVLATAKFVQVPLLKWTPLRATKRSEDLDCMNPKSSDSLVSAAHVLVPILQNAVPTIPLDPDFLQISNLSKKYAHLEMNLRIRSLRGFYYDLYGNYSLNPTYVYDTDGELIGCNLILTATHAARLETYDDVSHIFFTAISNADSGHSVITAPPFALNTNQLNLKNPYSLRDPFKHE